MISPRCSFGRFAHFPYDAVFLFFPDLVLIERAEHDIGSRLHLIFDGRRPLPRASWLFIFPVEAAPLHSLLAVRHVAPFGTDAREWIVLSSDQAELVL